VRTLKDEYRRKVRTMTRGLETLFYKRHLLNPFRYGLFAWELISHKLIRWLVPWSSLLVTLGLVVLALESAWARWALAGGGIGAAVALVGWLWPEGRRLPRLLAVPSYLVAGNVAALHAWINALRQEMNPTWEPTRRGIMSDHPGEGNAQRTPGP
jgi:hypothetical protein